LAKLAKRHVCRLIQATLSCSLAFEATACVMGKLAASFEGLATYRTAYTTKCNEAADHQRHASSLLVQSELYNKDSMICCSYCIFTHIDL